MVRDDDERRFSRAHTQLKAQYFLKGQKGTLKECTVTDVSRKGMGIKFHTSETINIGSTIYLEVFIPTALDPLNVQGVIRRVEKEGDTLTGSIELTKLLDDTIWGKLS